MQQHAEQLSRAGSGSEGGSGPTGDADAGLRAAPSGTVCVTV